jgi:thiol-disulfide isomerase/thioredoxin
MHFFIRLSLTIFTVVGIAACTPKVPSALTQNVDVNILDLSGKTRPFDDYLGSPTLLILWASWCQECLAELNTLNTASRLLGAHGIRLVAVAIQDDLENVKSLPQTSRAIYPILLDVKGDFLERYPTEGLPTAYLIDRTGKPIPLIDPEDGQASISIVGLRSWQSAAGQRAVIDSWSRVNK